MSESSFLGQHASNILEIVHGGKTPDCADPTENYVQASKLTREGLAWETPMIPVLMESEELQRTSMRSAKRYDSRPFEEFTTVTEISGSLQRALQDRRSERQFIERPIAYEKIASILWNSYGAYDIGHGQTRRNSPSGGALYPLDIFVISRSVDGLLENHLYFFDPFRRGLTDMREEIELPKFREALLLPEEIEEVPAFFVITASLWRSRFKYAQRAYRFCCMEAGHLAQNMLTIATDLGLGSRVFGGFIDDEVTGFLPDVNGVDDVPLYVLAVGEKGKM